MLRGRWIERAATPLVFSIAAVIPMVLGVFAYRKILGVIRLNGKVSDAYSQVKTDAMDIFLY